MSISDKITRLQTAKTNIATAITNKGGTVSVGDGFEDFSADIAGIPAGVDTSDATATASDIYLGKTAYIADGTKATGTLGARIIIEAPDAITRTVDGNIVNITAIQNPEWRNLPSGYTQLKYLQSTGTQYINTGYVPNTNSKFVYTYSDLTSGCLGGVWKKYILELNALDLASYNSTDNFYFYYVLSGEQVTKSASIGHDSDKHNVIFDLHSSLVVDGTEKFTITDYVYSNALNLYLFAINNKGSVSNNCSVKLYKFQIYDSDVLVRDFVPCKNSSNVYGLYDLANNTFYPNNGTGTFSIGEEVPQYISAYVYPCEKGSHTVTATFSSESKSETVLVDVITDYTVEIEETCYLYKLGREYTNITGGWRIRNGDSSYGNLTKNAQSMTLQAGPSATSSKSFSVITNNSIDFSNYTYLKFYFVDSTSYYGNNSGATNSETTYTSSGQISATAGVCTLRLSDYGNQSGQVYVLAYGYGTSSRKGIITVSKIWLE